MIRTEDEYQSALARVQDEEQGMIAERERLISCGICPEHADIALEPYLAFRMQLLDEIEEYEKLRRGRVDDVENLGGLGRRLVLLRIYRKLTQKQLAERLGVSVQQVCRDEKNEYYNAGTDKIQRVLEALGVLMRSSFEIKESIPA